MIHSFENCFGRYCVVAGMNGAAGTRIFRLMKCLTKRRNRSSRHPRPLPRGCLLLAPPCFPVGGCSFIASTLFSSRPFVFLVLHPAAHYTYFFSSFFPFSLSTSSLYRSTSSLSLPAAPSASAQPFPRPRRGGPDVCLPLMTCTVFLLTSPLICQPRGEVMCPEDFYGPY